MGVVVSELPSGTVTFLFTDLEGSTRLWEEYPDAMQEALAEHDDVIRQAVVVHGGHVVKTTGDGFHAAFATADDAIRAAILAQRGVAGHGWGEIEHLRVRMGLHTGAAELRDGDYYGSSLNRAARLMGVAHGGQIVCSQATADLARDSLADGVVLTDLGEHRLRDLSRPEQVFQVGAPDLRGEFAPLLSLDAFPGNLPLQLTSLVGRERELARVIEALGDARLVSLTGVGGVGKTRLALQVAADVLPRFQLGAWLCELAAVRSTESVVDAVAEVFDVTARSGQTREQALLDFLRHKELLVVLDNCEHVLDEAAELVEAIERFCPRTQVLATSREGLGIDGERILAVPSLAAPRVDASPDEVAASEAARLFAERARALKADFEITAENAAAVAQVCRRLDGMPLAIELAAARVPAMNPAELAARLDSRFQVLAGGRRGKVERHQTLRAVIDWSYDLLTPAEQRLLDRVTVFTGGWTLDAAESVCVGEPVAPAEVFGLTERLVARSLVIAEDRGFQTRYRLLETIRQYGEERLAEQGGTTELRRQHGAYYVEFASDMTERMEGPEQIECGERLAAEHENILAAVAVALDTDDVESAYRWIRNLPWAGLQIGYQLRLPIEAILTMPGASDHPDYPLALTVAAFHAASRGDRELSMRRAEEARVAQCRHSSTPVGEVDALLAGARSTNLFSVGAWAEAAREIEQSLEIWRSLDHLPQLAYSLAGTAALYATAGDAESAIPLASEGLALARKVRTPATIVMNLNALASALAELEPERARSLLRESLELSGRLGYENTQEVTNGVLTAARLHDWPIALELAAPAIAHLHWVGDRPQLAGVLNVVARAVAEEDPEAAAVLQGASRRLALADLSTTPNPPPSAPAQAGGGGLGLVGELRREATGMLDDALGGERRRELRAAGEAMDEDQAVTYALSHIRIALDTNR
jgi:predicted ATPase/class 3 adenylate cyclase